ncbi:MAG: DnaJ family domain-containing protein [Thermodesulfobacteriota bacterium]|nr:DnaJ family domain-containing protein [Thermodesulfobacteriota bacterium]
MLLDGLSAIQRIAERKIIEAYKKGEFDNLSGKGKPLNLESDSRIPEELRTAYKILKNANVLPPEVELAKKIQSIEALLSSITDDRERYEKIKILNMKIMEFNLMRKGPIPLGKEQFYYKKLIEKNYSTKLKHEK